MPLRFRNRRLPGGACLASMCQSVALVIVLLAACSTQPQSGPVAQVPPSSSQSEQCSLVGRLACAAMSSLSGDAGQNRQAACFVSRVAGKTVETCGFVETKPQTNEADRRPRPPDSVELAWADNLTTRRISSSSAAIKLASRPRNKRRSRPALAVGGRLLPLEPILPGISIRRLYRIRPTFIG